MDDNDLQKKKNHPILNWIMLIFGILLVLPGGYFLSIFFPILFDGALESVEAPLVFILICLSGLVFLTGVLLIYFGIKRAILHLRSRS